jgi:3-deoxy-manno-octulosonate cytidylyltransferase (CMP-KDO synthetase)
MLLVNVQGDEPLLPPILIDQLAKLMTRCAGASMASLCEPITSLHEFENPNVVKVVMDGSGRALYFSRAPIPWPREAFGRPDRSLPADMPAYRHIGMYAYRASILRQYVQWPPATLERVECLEQLRALANGAHIQMALAEVSPPAGIDTADDLARVRRILEQGRD